MTRSRARWVFSLILLVLPATAGAQSPAPPPDLDAYVREVMAAFEVPGLALAIVKDGQVVVAEGYGVRRLGGPAPVDAHTLFGIASNTKVFTAAALGLLVEEGRLRWDTPVVDILPWFSHADPYVTREITIRDLLVHNSGLGLGAGDLLWWPPSTYDRKEIVRRLRYIPLETSFRSAYAYDNVLYAVAGEVIEATTGQTWEAFVAARLLAPVGMTDSDVRYVATKANVATPHARVEGAVRVIAPFTGDNVNPPGGINASATDMAKWLTVLLGRGRLPDGERLYSEATARALWTVVTPIAPGDPAPELEPLRANFSGYGLGLFLRDYRGHKLVTHTGGLPGYISRVALLPDLGVGVAVLTNHESAAMDPITFRILDHYLGADYDWLTAFRTVVARGDSLVAAQEQAGAAARDSTVGPSLPLARYAGIYTDPWYGDIVVTQEGGRLGIRFAHTPSLVGDLTHWQYDTFVARWHDRELRADAFVTFQLDAEGGIDRVLLKPVSPATDFSFDFEDLELEPAGQ